MQGSRGCSLTEADAGVVLANAIALLVGKEHVRGQATLGGIRVCWMVLAIVAPHWTEGARAPFFFLLSATFLALLGAAFALGMVCRPVCSRSPVSQRARTGSWIRVGNSRGAHTVSMKRIPMVMRGIEKAVSSHWAIQNEMQYSTSDNLEHRCRATEVSKRGLV